MVTVQDEQQVQSANHCGVGDVFLSRNAEGHTKEVFGQTQRVVWVEHRLTDALLVGVSGDRGDLGQEANGRDLDLLLVKGIQAVLVERRQRTDSAGKHGHGVRITRETIKERTQAFLQHRVTANAGVKFSQLLSRGELAVDQQIGHFQEG